MNPALLIAMSSGTFWTIVAIVVILLVLGIFVYDGDTDWFDD